jgi:D-aspartate ligase
VLWGNDSVRERALPPILLGNAEFYGTLAATRALGGEGVPVYVADVHRGAPARWSNRVARRLKCPSMSDTEAFLRWLESFGGRAPGAVLYPTSDDAAYLYATRRDALSRSFRMYQPDVETMMTILDKRRLYEAAATVGIDVPRSWFPESEAEVARIGRIAPMPLLIKPRTQILSHTRSKGVIVRRVEELVPRYRQFVRTSAYGKALRDRYPESALPMLQEHHPSAAENILELSLFIDRTGTLFAARAARKVLQRPRSLGIGLCFEPTTLDPTVADSVRRLARACGYFGVLQIEFIEVGERRLLIDGNPRFYNQMALDIARGLPMPQMAYAASRDDAATLRQLVEDANKPSSDRAVAFCNRLGMKVMLAAQRAVGKLSTVDASRWRAWVERYGRDCVDPARADDDAVPAFVDALNQFYGYARHPRAFLREIVLDRT